MTEKKLNELDSEEKVAQPKSTELSLEDAFSIMENDANELHTFSQELMKQALKLREQGLL